MTGTWAKRIVFLFVLMLVVSSAIAAKPSGADSGQTTLERVRPRAKQGNPAAEYNMGVIYARGYGVQRDYDKARAWYKKAAAQDYAKAAHNLGVMYRKGQGVSVDNRRAAHWFRKAARLGEPAAQNNLAVMYAEGLGVEKNLPLAAVWMARAARAGNDSAIANLPVITAGLPKTTISGSNVNIRPKPTTDSAVLTQADAGTEVVVLQQKATWSRVLLLSEHRVGWVADSLLASHKQVAAGSDDDRTAPAEPAVKTVDATATDESAIESDGQSHPQKVVGASNLNVREQPSRQAPVLFQLQRGDHVSVVKNRNGWAYVKLSDGRGGWVAGYYLVDA